MTADPVTPEVKCECFDTKRFFCDPHEVMIMVPHRVRSNTPRAESVTSGARICTSTPFDTPAFLAFELRIPLLAGGLSGIRAYFFLPTKTFSAEIRELLY